MIDLLQRHAQITPADSLEAKLAAGKPLRVKLGVDPTAPHVHLGWAVVLRKLRQFQDAGHQAVLIVGDFTARIGDPSGQNATRPMLTAAEVNGFADRLIEQFGAILDLGSLEVRRNSEWLEPLGVEGVLRLASQMTVARMLERDDFSKRFEAHQPITITEFLYPLMQGYDSVAINADIELGGTDQLFNLHVGRALQAAAGQPPQALVTVPLLVGTDGVVKMSQSKGNYIGIDEPPEEMFGKTMRIPDSALPDWLRLAAWWPDDRVEEAMSTTPNPSELKRELAKEIIRQFHPEGSAESAESHFNSLFVEHAVPDDIEEWTVTGDEVHLPKLLVDSGLVASSSEARRNISQGGVKLDGEAVETLDWPAGELKGRVLQVGKRKFLRLV